MKRAASYNTRQSEAIMSYLASLEGEHVTAADIAARLENDGRAIGLTTVYRHLDKLVASGALRKYVTDGVAGACYQYVRENEGCAEHFHLKCEQCGELLHLRCDIMDEISAHLLEDHSFRVNPMKTVFYGRCANCLAV